MKPVERCRERLDGVRCALLAAWQELAERGIAGSVSVRTTNIGQQVSMPSEVGEGIT